MNGEIAMCVLDDCDEHHDQGQLEEERVITLCKVESIRK